MQSRGFTLLEVMVAVAILGLALTVILSAQAGIYTSGANAHKESIAIGLARCKMGEAEENLMRYGYPELDLVEEGECCEEQTPKGFSCEWKVERIELPQPLQLAEQNPAGGGDLDLSGAGPGAGMPNLPNGPGPIGALMAASGNDSQMLKNAGGPDGGFQALAGMLGDSATGGIAGVVSMIFGDVYPLLKPMLEASIRKITVEVKWRQGIRSRDLTVVQYVTNPMQGGISGVDPESSTSPFGSAPPFLGGP